MDANAITKESGDEHSLIVGALPFEASEFGVCLPKDQALATHISHAISALELSNLADPHDFAFFDFEPSQLEREALSHVHISDFRNWGLFDDEILDLREFAEVFIQKFGLNQSDTSHAPIIADLIVRIVRTIIGESRYASCKIMLRTYSTVAQYTIDWHIDKMPEEIIGLPDSMSLTQIQSAFIIPLYGEPTLFYQADTELRTAWNQAAEELPFTYGGLPVQHLIANQSKVVSAKHEQGSVHKTGRTIGAIHASPNPGECWLNLALHNACIPYYIDGSETETRKYELKPARLLLIVLPGNREAILGLQAFEKYHARASRVV